MIQKYDDFVNEAKKSLVIPKSMQTKLDNFAAKGWWIGKIDTTVLSKIKNYKLLLKEFERCEKYAGYSTYIDFSSTGDYWTIEFMETVDYGSSKFENASGKVPYQVEIGPKILFSYATVVSSSDQPYSVREFKEFITLNMK